MNYIEVSSYDELSRKAANIIAAQVIMKPCSVLGLATGSSPLGTYEKLAKLCKAGDVDFSAVTSVNLDEYVGLSPDNEQSYRYFMDKNLFSKINIDRSKTYVPDGCAADIKAEGERYDALIEKLGGIDIQLLGIGHDGHIGFNEPDEFFTKETHLVSLDPSTIEANARFFASKDEVPTKAITMGIMSIMQAKKVLLIANGKNKKDIVEKSFFGPITPKIPASVLQLHPDLTVIYCEN
ncbi:MAG: glucosamine-6-phosphate deaminase [Eubacteriales bacterium]|nr:glucosamine-6-phosphate deaminase [Eubacteriales bacterium]